MLKSWNHVASIDELTKDRPSYQQFQKRILTNEEKPQTNIQHWISERWRELLGLDAIGIEDNFFVIGGHSLAAVQFMAKVKNTFHVKTHLMNLYELPTLQAFSDFLENQIRQKQAIPFKVGSLANEYDEEIK